MSEKRKLNWISPEEVEEDIKEEEGRNWL